MYILCLCGCCFSQASTPEDYFLDFVQRGSAHSSSDSSSESSDDTIEDPSSVSSTASSDSKESNDMVYTSGTLLD